MQATPIVQPIPVEVEEESAAPAAAPVARESRVAAPQRTASGAPEPAAQQAQQTEPVAPQPVNTDYFPVETTALSEEPLGSEEVLPAAQSPNDPDNAVIKAIDGIAWGAAGTVLLLALFSGPLRRRRPKDQPPVVTRPAVTAPPVRHSAQPLAEPAAPAAVAATVTPLTIQPLFGQPLFGRPTGASTVRRRGGEAVDLPRRLPARFEERDALLFRMLDAPPDKANPFRSRRARLKRARLILQSIGRKFEHADPWIDLSDYPHVWPELARRKHLQAA